MTFSLHPHVTATETEHGTVLLDQRRGRYFQLNPTGARVLQLMLNGASHEHAARELSEQYGISGQQAQADVTALLTALHTAKLTKR
ncbi:lasso peptide biosynthesis PqqD family chaperone [Streptomyces morookaense]|uniref:Lasso peptide biosynthesis PqqD family chaperone n=1 Tax=Streptomyces morookaense TaxID=1970 RepID=A0A7Y7E8I4_STRMO|nr:lasso peptide biosynthesis PqqD family chaperone [Streptomyces morookaense]NVK80043.1 lasso peptide biosynthesis PqqD family chaperone [Streptomyces morookaense]GHF41779.1 hypothetical protein GCM10010359_50570 [Streptomyces morookaense]